MKKQKKAKPHYVSNKDFYTAMVEWKDGVNRAANDNQIPPPLNNYIGECIYKIANKLSHRPNFMNYTYRDEMVSDGIENCIQYADRFNPEKSKNPFAYFTQIIYYAFLRRIEKEKKQSRVRDKMIRSNTQTFSVIVGDTESYSVSGRKHADFWKDSDLPSPPTIKKKTKKKVKPVKEMGLERFMNDKIENKELVEV